ncbi:helix-hairpin-helix domain-containing protein [Sporosarcina sp. D27]|uniref:helix-hairpin-helix domain-containing protein n=1 Tax=Sporosarcina sp. D27 TaxID=1382305 RepID=UPI0004B8D989|nr:helix-hairpin-helix domain-containing protein [Sporosarcina sp. D27]
MFFPRGQGDDEHFPDESLYDSLDVTSKTPLEVTPGHENVELVADPAPQTPELIIVDVKGAVIHPNVYTLQEGQRLIDAITAAGGYTSDADSRLLNHAQRLTDEAVIYVPLIGEELPVFENLTGGSDEKDESGAALVNINTADETELMTLTGIGPAKASAIVKHRTEQGVFQTIEDLKNISGIGQKTFDALSDSITVN